MPLLSIIVVVAVFGLILYLVNTYVPMDSKVKMILNWVVVIILVVWLLQVTGIVSNLRGP